MGKRIGDYDPPDLKPERDYATDDEESAAADGRLSAKLTKVVQYYGGMPQH